MIPLIGFRWRYN